MLGMSLSGGSVVGVWALLLLMTCAAAYVLFRLIERLTDTTSATVGTAIYVMSLQNVIHQGGFTEDFTQLFAVLGVSIGAHLLLGTWSPRRQVVLSFVAGLSLGALAITRANLVG